MNNPILLGVNIDHVATLRQQRHTSYPNPIAAALLAEKAGADGITLHLREDRRHIQDNDVEQLRTQLITKMNLEMAVTDEMINFAKKVKPQDCCLVPEKREELTTEGGLDIISNETAIRKACDELHESDVIVSLFIDPDLKQLDAALRCNVKVIEIHTGQYAEAIERSHKAQELERIKIMAKAAKEAGLQVNAGHGLHYKNVQEIAAIPEITELNIGHSIIAEAIFIGIPAAVTAMRELMQLARQSG